MNANVYELAQGNHCRDDVRMIGSKEVSIDDLSVHAFKEDIERSNVAIYSWGSWFDSGTADGVIKRFLTYSNPLRVVIGPWNHGARYHASPYKPRDTPVDVRQHPLGTIQVGSKAEWIPEILFKLWLCFSVRRCPWYGSILRKPPVSLV